MDEFSTYIDHDAEEEIEALRAKLRAFASASEDVVRACAQFIGPHCTGAVYSLERLAALAGLPPAILNRALGR